MATVISLCANLKEIDSVELLKQNRSILINNKDSFFKCNQEKHFSDESYQATSFNHDQHSQEINHSKHKNLISDWLSNFQCDDLLCKISYTTLALSDVIFITGDHQIVILPLTSGFISHTPKQLHRPPIVLL
ncbi:MAG: hypothetical protein H6937_11160 [Burkholderiales bacterium]|nr:hypothetical protein [Burkholderiales bacterium]MDR4516361.1 hypothetical protein [Nitrosomonas sp.]